MIKHKLENNLSHISYDAAIDIANTIVSRFSNRRDFIDSLVSEGVLSKNISWKNPEEEIIYFAYERFEDQLLTAYLLDTHLNINDPKMAFQKDGPLAQYLNNSYQYQGIVEALSIQIPERIDKELYELLADEKKPNRANGVSR